MHALANKTHDLQSHINLFDDRNFTYHLHDLHINGGVECTHFCYSPAFNILL